MKLLRYALVMAIVAAGCADEGDRRAEEVEACTDHGEACTPELPCHRGVVSCASGTRTCLGTEVRLEERTGCGDHRICHEGDCLPDAYAIHVLVRGLTGAGLTLQDAAAGDLSVPGAGAYRFPTLLPAESTYAVTVSSQPTSPWQTCAVTSGSGALGWADAVVLVTCETDSHALGGSVAGLAGSGLVLATTGEPDLPVLAGATRFAFADLLPSGAGYEVRVVQQPTSPHQACTVEGGSGLVGGEDVAGVVVTCSTDRYALGGRVSGLACGTTLVLSTAGEPDLLVSSVGDFRFANPIASGSAYDVRVTRQPTSPWQTCTVTAGAGTATDAPVTSIVVSCTVNAYAIGGAIAGLAGTGLILASPGEPNLRVAAGATTFRFSTRLPSGDRYQVSVAQQPTNQVCTVTSGSGTVAGADVTGIAVRCAGTYTVGGTIEGLVAPDTALILASGSEPLTIGAEQTRFTFAGRFLGGAAYDVVVLQQPSFPSQTCGVTRGAGTIGTANVIDVVVRCRSAWKQVSAGGGFALGVRPDGTLWAWGRNDLGQLGLSPADGTRRPTPVQIGSGYSSVAAGRQHGVGAKTDGTLWAWGSPSGEGIDPPTRVVVPGTGEFSSVAAGSAHSLAVRSDGTLWAWGNNSFGQLGVLPNAGGWRETPLQVIADTGSRFVAVAAGPYHSVALVEDGALRGWGDASAGELGTPGTTGPNGPRRIDNGHAHTSVAAGGTGDWTGSRWPSHTLAIRDDGVLLAWGDNEFGQLGVVTSGAIEPYPQVVGTGYAFVTAGGRHTVAIQTDGTLRAWGDNASGQLGTGDLEARGTPALVGRGFRAAAAGDLFTLAIAPDGTLSAWGNNSWGQLGIGSTEESVLVPTPVP